MNVLSSIYYVFLPTTTIVSYISNFQMIESLSLFKNFITEPKSKVVNKKNQIFLRITLTLVLLIPTLFGTCN